MSNVPNWTGPWNISTSYSAYDLVSFGPTTWIATTGNAGSQPGSTSAWAIFAQGGKNGINTWRGVWQSGTIYNAFDAVSYVGTSYVSLINANQSNVPAPNSNSWAVLAASGGPGPAGDFTFSGVWASTSGYVLNDIVSYNGSSYALTGSSTVGINPAADPANWSLIASVGVQGATGPQGVQGPIGVGFAWRGAWSNLTSYHVMDVVGLLGSSYVAVTANLGVNPSTDSGANWQLVALAGVNGTNVLVLQTNGVGNSIQNKLNVTGAGTVAASIDAFGNLTINGTSAVESVFGQTGVITSLTVGGGESITFTTSGSPATPGVINANELYGVVISGTPPITGQVLTATSPTSANWQTHPSGTIGGSIAVNQVAVGTGTNMIGGSSNFTFDSTQLLTINAANAVHISNSGAAGITITDTGATGIVLSAVTGGITFGASTTKSLKINISNTALLALPTPIPLIPTPGTNQLIVVTKAIFQYRFVTTPYSIPNVDNIFALVYRGTENNITLVMDTTGLMDQTENAIAFEIFSNPSSSTSGGTPLPSSPAFPQSGCLGLGLDLTLQGTTPALTGGGGNLEIVLEYALIDLS